MHAPPHIAKMIKEKMKEISNVSNDYDLASILGIAPGTLSGQINQGKIPDRWIKLVFKDKRDEIINDILRENFADQIDDHYPKKTKSNERAKRVSEISYRESLLRQNQPRSTTASETEYGYKIPPAEFKRMVATRFDSIFQWLAEEFEGSSPGLEVWMAEFMKKFMADYPDYRQWLYMEAEKKHHSPMEESANRKKNAGK